MKGYLDMPVEELLDDDAMTTRACMYRAYFQPRSENVKTPNRKAMEPEGLKVGKMLIGLEGWC